MSSAELGPQGAVLAQEESFSPGPGAALVRSDPNPDALQD